ncbi:uncharacterized protein TRIADDRAFT_54341 [Trichoplax adhaerens]|uniref:Voltage-gated hydrogen channel 1 n=1 Tax=Trichoplax adhaerens TaxID=10228 RepID=B3RRR9_TRIAD|nr:hypothetical protein TRIADDRAFT_54341 [Trichoplax adhaerens]EDV26918.1 hypothetical protein TRIADDRAFT_54341 [Trichoplax adhaerens]|eukprot:XP_002110914.1 hypothetical protein TRIADDRAFT_54341 [Trichoplax adhaerens]
MIDDGDNNSETLFAVHGDNEGMNPPQSVTWRSDHRAKLRQLIYSHKVHIAIVVLVILDALIVIAELLIDLSVIKVHHTSPLARAFHFTSIAILAIFLVEIVLKLYASDLAFFLHYFEVFDALIVIVSFVLDIAYSNSEALSGVGLLVVLRLWRIARIVNGIISSVKSQANDKIHHLRRELEKTRSYLEQKLDRKEAEIQLLKKVLTDRNIPIPKPLLEVDLNGNSTAQANGSASEEITVDIAGSSAKSTSSAYIG